MSDPTEKPEAIQQAEALIKRHNHWNLLSSLLFTVLIIASAMSVATFPIGGGILMATVGAVFIGFFVVHNAKNAETLREAKSLIQVFDTKRAALALAHDIVSPELGDLSLSDGRWQGSKALLERVRTLAEGDLETNVVIDDIANYLIEVFQDVESLNEGLAAEQAMSSDSAECAERIARFGDGIERRNHQIDALLTALRDVHVELSMRETDSTEELSHQLRDLFHRARADNEVRQSENLPREELPVSDAKSTAQQKVLD